MPTSAQKITDYLQQKGQVSGADLADYLSISRQALYKHLTKLLHSGAIAKIGKPPRVFYYISQTSVAPKIMLADDLKKFIEERYLIITPAGERKDGTGGFIYWCDKNHLPVQKTAAEYRKTLRKYDANKKGGLIDGLPKIAGTFSKVFLDKLFYLDFYSIERFGKTKLGQLLLYAKQSQNLLFMKEIIAIVKPSVSALIAKYRIDGVGFIPPTVKRERQLMRVLENGLNEDLRKVSIVKIKTAVAVPQKTLNKLDDRIENAKNTLVVDEPGHFKNILLVDDAVGSGATLNETAKKIKEKGICRGNIIGLALIGSFKGFDVISEV